MCVVGIDDMVSCDRGNEKVKLYEDDISIDDKLDRVYERIHEFEYNILPRVIVQGNKEDKERINKAYEDLLKEKSDLFTLKVVFREYENNKEFKDYVDKYATKYGIAIETALKHKIVRYCGGILKI